MLAGYLGPYVIRAVVDGVVLECVYYGSCEFYYRGIMLNGPYLLVLVLYRRTLYRLVLFRVYFRAILGVRLFHHRLVVSEGLRYLKSSSFGGLGV